MTMKHKILKTILCALLLCAAACTPRTIAGDYRLTNMTSNGREYKDDLQVMETMGLSASMHLDEDGTGTVQLFQETYVVSWNDKTIRMDGIDNTYTVKNGVLVMNRGEDSLTFTRLEGTSDK